MVGHSDMENLGRSVESRHTLGRLVRTNRAFRRLLSEIIHNIDSVCVCCATNFGWCFGIGNRTDIFTRSQLEILCLLYAL